MYDKDLMNQLIKLHLEQGRTYQSLQDEFGVSKSSISYAVRRFQKEAEANEEKAKILADMKRLRKLEAENEELKKEVDFLKKAAAFFAKENN